jgi:hypothetical protein
MEKKIVGILLCMLIIITAALPAIGVESLVSDKENILVSNNSLANENMTIDITKPKGIYFFDKQIIPISFNSSLAIGPITVIANFTADEGTILDRVECHIYNKKDKEVFTDMKLINDSEEPYDPYLCNWNIPAFDKHIIEVILYDDQNDSISDTALVWKIF